MKIKRWSKKAGVSDWIWNQTKSVLFPETPFERQWLEVKGEIAAVQKGSAGLSGVEKTDLDSGIHSDRVSVHQETCQS